MFAFGFALVPLYDVFCEALGINGKPSSKPEQSDEFVIDNGRPIALQFISQIIKICHGPLNLLNKS